MAGLIPDFSSVLKTPCCEGNEWAIKDKVHPCGNLSASGKFSNVHNFTLCSCKDIAT
jgi:hypothetical protein